MASLIEEFIRTLEKENSEYEELLEISSRKTPIIVKGDVEALAKITDEEQLVVDRIAASEKRRTELLSDIATVLNKDVHTLRIPRLIELLERQKPERDALAAIHEKLKVTAENMKVVNERNRSLIELSLDMVRFDMNLLQASKQSPQTGDYNKNGSYSAGDAPGGISSFDSKS